MTLPGFFLQPWIAVPALVTFPISAAMSYGTFVPQSRMWGRNISHGPRRGPARVALTFDDGPTADFTVQAVQALNELGVAAAFFAVGANVAKHPEIVRLIDASGHVVGNHSYSHDHFAFLYGRGYWRGQLGRTNDLLCQILGKRPALFRPPMGIKTWHVVRAAKANGQTLITWSLRAMDGVPTTTARILARILPNARPGDIISLHDGIEPFGNGHPQATIAAIRPLVIGLRARGFQVVRLDQLLGIEPYAAA